ncbi:MAG: excinuclease ABC subunit UvrA, partial [Pseudomonadota bacterium]
KIKHDIEVVVDRLVIREGLQNRLAQSIESALELNDGIVIAHEVETDNSHLYSTQFACPVSGFTIPELEPRLFSFNSPFGACSECDGLGTFHRIEADLVVPDQQKSLVNGAIYPWAGYSSPYYQQTLAALAQHFDQSVRTPWQDLSQAFRDAVLYGTRQAIRFHFDDGTRSYTISKPFEGVVNNLERRYRETESNWSRDEISKYMALKPCQACNGTRLRIQALAVKLADLHIADVCAMSIREAQIWFERLSDRMDSRRLEIARPILYEINARLGFLMDVGLDYLTLGRTAGTLSGGEGQRIRLASQIGSGLTSVLYVLDEPSIGLHQRDNAKLLATLARLRDAGNSVLVVEHDEEAIRTADHVVDMGPGAGIHGGHVVCAGAPEAIAACKDSITGQYLSGVRTIAVPSRRRKGSGYKLEIIGASGNNLRGFDISFPLGCFICVTGVSGSGKSTLVIETLYKALSRSLMHSSERPAAHKSIKGLHHLDKVIDIDQSPIGRTPRSNPATYTGVFSPIREWFAGLPEARARGYTPGRFSFNVRGGRCEACQGGGLNRIEMHFLPDLFVECEQCKGKRYNRETLQVCYRGKSIADVLDMTVDEACDFFKAIPVISEKLVTLREVGLGYIKTGQSATTLSGGEAQRVKLARELSKRATGRTMYILDEPTTGLHFEDIRRLLCVLQRLVDQGNSLVVIEHNLDVIKMADWIIDIGPEGGDGGGQVIA